MKPSVSRRGLPALTALFTGIIALLHTPGARAQGQVPAVKYDVPAARGMVVTPVYEGWYEAEGTKYALFTYYNRNTEEIVDVPIGPQNNIAPGPADQGQPTRFFPGIYYGVFAVPFPKDQPKAEMTWTLAANGQTLSIPATLDMLYLIAPQKETGGAYPGNTPPVLKFDASGPSGQGPHGLIATRTATAGAPLALEVSVADDNIPPPPKPGSKPAGRGSTRVNPLGLTLSWQVYRGAGGVKFSNPMPRVEQGKASTTVTFSAPGEYMLNLLAIDSRTATRCCWTNGYVKVTVAGQKSP
jgi:hypothetical protein